MHMQQQLRHPQIKLAAAAVFLAFAGSTLAASENLPDIGGSAAAPWVTDIYYENHTARREHVGLAKFRNTGIVDAKKQLDNGWALHSSLRGTWDGVYRMNSSQYGRDAGGAIQLESRAAGTMVSHGAGTGTVNNPFGAFVPANAVNFPAPLAGLDFNSALNPNSGLRVLGDRWHPTAGGVAFGVPVRPCDTDSRGCTDFGGYGNQKLSELESPEFNNRLDFMREMYVKKTFTLSDGTDFFLKLGKQQVVWGRTDLFRVLDVINPVDYSRNNIYDELSDIRIPMWIAQAEWRMGPSESMQERNFQVVWNFDKFRANNLGQCGTPNTILDAGCFFRGMKNLWDNGGTVANFAGSMPGAPGLATNFGPHQIGIRDVHLPNWSLGNTQLGVKYEGVSQNGLSFSLNALTYRSQLPSLRGSISPAINPFAGAIMGAGQPATNAGTAPNYLIAFDMYFPRVNLVGGSLDFQIPAANAAIRLEGAVTQGEEFANTARPELYSKNNVFRGVLGVDRPTFIPFISTSRATLISAQLFYQHIFKHEVYRDAAGDVYGMPDWKDNVTGTLLIKGFLANDRVSPQLILARDFKAKAYAVAPQVEWSITNDLKLTFGANFKGGKGANGNEFDDCRDCNPYPSAGLGSGAGTTPGSISGVISRINGFEPLGRFRAGPIGTAFNENDIFFMMRYKF